MARDVTRVLDLPGGKIEGDGAQCCHETIMALFKSRAMLQSKCGTAVAFLGFKGVYSKYAPLFLCVHA